MTPTRRSALANAELAHARRRIPDADGTYRLADLIAVLATARRLAGPNATAIASAMSHALDHGGEMPPALMQRERDAQAAAPYAEWLADMHARADHARAEFRHAWQVGDVAGVETAAVKIDAAQRILAVVGREAMAQPTQFGGGSKAGTATYMPNPTRLALIGYVVSEMLHAETADPIDRSEPVWKIMEAWWTKALRSRPVDGIRSQEEYDRVLDEMRRRIRR